MLGAFAVGKTSLVRRFVKSIFSEKYKTTLGVKIDKKQVHVKGDEVNLLLWDLPGEDDFQSLQESYLRGASGYLLVGDGTRSDTLDTAFRIQKKTEAVLGKVPFILVINKSDLSEAWDLEPGTLNDLRERGLTVFETSAKTGKGVEEVFVRLAEQMLKTG